MKIYLVFLTILILFLLNMANFVLLMWFDLLQTVGMKNSLTWNFFLCPIKPKV